MERGSLVLRKIALRIAVLGLVAGLGSRFVYAQVLRMPRPAANGVAGDGEESAENKFPSPDRSTLQLLARAREASKQGRYGEALEGLGEILKGGEDFFFQPDKKQPIYRSLKAEARQVIGQMPREGRELYEVRYGAEARQRLKQAVAAGDCARMADVSGQYFHTQAGYEATFLLGLYHLDRGSPLAGGLMFKRLREGPDAADRFEPALSLAMAACWVEAGMPEEARRTLVDLHQRRPNLSVKIAGHEVPWFDRQADPVAWLARLTGPQRGAGPVEADRWAMVRGDPARNASAKGSPPLLNMRWRIPVTDDPAVEDVLRGLDQTYREKGITVVSSLHPLAVDDIVLMRTVRNLLAVDFATGKRLWEVPTDDPLEAAGVRTGADGMLRQGSPWPTQVGQRIWDDAAYGTLSSDGRLVFSIEDLSLGIGGGNVHMGMAIFGAGGARSDAASRALTNRLTAHDVHSGKLKWELGGPAGQFSLRQAETFFLGPPLPLRGQLYVLAEIKDEVRLMALDAASGNLLWSQQLTMVERSIAQDPLRRMAGLSPSYADGILVCPTGAGAVVAVDLATRALLWGYRYGHGGNAADPNRQNQFLQLRYGMYTMPMPRWLDGTAAIVDGRVLLTPAEGDRLHCLNLIDGTPAWEPVARQEDLYVACVHHGAIVLVGRREVHALRLADGKPAWDGRTVPLPAGAAVTGRGFYSGHQYFLPLSSAEVMAIDLDAGRKLLLAKSRKGGVPGNLVCYRGKVISQGLDGLETFYQVDAIREEIRQRLAAKADDAEALTLRGEMLLDEGKSAEAVADFRRAYELDGNGESHPRSRELLRDALLDGLRCDFAAHQKYAGEVERLLDDSTQRAVFLRLMAAGLQQLGQWQAALEQLLKLADLDDAKRPMETLDHAYRVRRDRWIQGRLASLRRDAGPEASRELDRILAERLRAATASEGLGALRRFLDYFGNQPAAVEARRELLARLIRRDRLLEAELLVRSQPGSAGPAAEGAALADLAAMFTQAGRGEAAAACYEYLASQYPDVVCREGRTGAELAAALPADSPVRRALGAHPTWPVGEVEVTRGGNSESRTSVYGRFPITFQTRPGPFYENASIRFDQNRQMILGYDELGRERWEVPLVEGGNRLTFGYNSNMTQARAQGHLLLVSMGSKIFGVDPLGLSGNSSKLLWSQDMNDATADLGGANQIVVQGGGMLMFGGPFGMQQQFSFRMNPFGPVTSRYVCFQRFRNVVVVDPLTGDPLWIRQDIPANSEMFGDDELVFVLPPGESEAMVFSAIDGELLGKRRVERPKQSGGDPFNDGLDRSVYQSFHATGMATIGRYVLTWEPGPAQCELSLLDPWAQRPAWPARKFAAGARSCLLWDEAVGVFEPDGHFVLLSLPDGRAIADVKLQPESSLSEIVLTPLGDQYFLLVHDATPRGHMAGRPIQPLPGTLYQPIRRARLYALDRQGKPMWPRPAEVRDQHFLLSQPARLPVLVFACGRFEQRKDGHMWTRTYVLGIDRRTGRVIYDKDIDNLTMTLDLVGDAEKKTVDLRMQIGSVVLAFTDKPVVLPPAGTPEPKQPPGNLLDALWQALEKSATGGVPRP